MRVRLAELPFPALFASIALVMAPIALGACASASTTSEDDPALTEEAGGSDSGEGGSGGDGGSDEGGASGSGGTTAGKGGASGKGGGQGGAGGGQGGASGSGAGGGAAGAGGAQAGGAGGGPGGGSGTGGTAGTGGTSSCGDGKKAPTEQCDGADFGGGTCASLFGDPNLTGNLVCTGNCQVDTKGCVKNPKCGDGMKNVATEECDGNGGKSCADVLGDPKASGALGCDGNTCKIISTDCQKGPFCGNGTKDGTEECDSSDIGKSTCASATGDPEKTGSVSCAADCKLDTSKCVVGAKCGDGSKNADTEQCDGADLNGATCKSALGNTNATGTLACAADCQLDKSGCTVPPVCGDGTKNVAAEECDGQDFGGETCESKLGKGHAGSLLCGADCKIGTGACTVVAFCGDGAIDAGEQCDGAALGADATCEKVVGFMSTGTITCAANCSYDTAGCSKPVTCGNGKLDAGEECDASLLGGKTCADALGDTHGIGTLACSAACTFDTAGCSIGPYCGNGKLDAGEECDNGPGNGGLRCTSKCKVQCDTIEEKLGTHCYVDSDLYFNNKTYDQAAAFCASVPNGHLVTISSKAELDFIYNNVMPGTFDAYDTAARWIGLNDMATEGAFVWINGEPVTYTNWNGGEPNNSSGNEDCGEMSWSNGSWNDNNCSKTHTFICEVEPAVQFP
jgi:hypothetical protein